MMAVERSGLRSRSLSSTCMKPGMELPSKLTPSSRAWGSWLARTAMFFWVPKISQNANRTNLTSFSSTNSRMSCRDESLIARLPLKIYKSKRPKGPLADIEQVFGLMAVRK